MTEFKQIDLENFWSNSEYFTNPRKKQKKRQEENLLGVCCITTMLKFWLKNKVPFIV